VDRGAAARVHRHARRHRLHQRREAADVTPRSAYRLRAHPDAASFVAAWDRALLVATGRLAAVAFNRAINGTVREVWKDGELVGQVRTPSDKLLMFLLARLDARRFGAFAGMAVASDDPLVAARTGTIAAIDTLGDIDCAAEPLTADQYRAPPLTDIDGLPLDD
jgi:hypothetical protein